MHAETDPRAWPSPCSAPTAAFAHTGHGETASLFAGLQHPLSGLDHMTAMLAVGLLAALKGGRALWLWPLTFVGVMIAGGRARHGAGPAAPGRARDPRLGRRAGPAGGACHQSARMARRAW